MELAVILQVRIDDELERLLDQVKEHILNVVRIEIFVDKGLDSADKCFFCLAGRLCLDVVDAIEGVNEILVSSSSVSDELWP